MDQMLEQKELRRIRLVMFVVLLLTVLTQLIDNAFTLSTPILVERFQISTDMASWVASLGGVGIAIGFLAFSSFTDFISEKKLLIIGLLLFCLPSITGLLFQNYYFAVVASRFVQAIGGISTSALYLVLIARYLPEKEQVIWMGLCTASFTVSTVIGTLTGGFLSSAFGWQVIFYIPFIGLLALPIIIKYLPSATKESNTIDVLGFVLLSLFIIAINFLTSQPTLTLLIASILLLVLFLIYIAKAKNPLISLVFFKNKSYMMTLLATFFYYLSQVALVFVTPFLLQSVFNFSLEDTSLIYILPYTVSGVIAAFSGNIINKIGMKKALVLGAILIMGGFVFGACLAPNGIPYVLASLTLITGGYALSFAPFLTKAISSLEEKEVGTGIGFFNFIVRTANALGISLTAFLLNLKLPEILPVITGNSEMHLYSYIFIFLAFMTFIGIVVYLILTKNEKE